MGEDWSETHAPICEERGRLAKYASTSSRSSVVTCPVNRVERSMSGHQKVSEARASA